MKQQNKLQKVVTTQQAVSPDDILSPKQVADWFGLNVKTIYNLVNEGEIPHRPAGRKILFLRSALIEWLSGKGRVSCTDRRYK